MPNNDQRIKTRKWLWLFATLFSLIAFSANSIFCRLALRDGLIDPESFTAIRLFGGSIFLVVLLTLSRKSVSGGSWRGGLYLFVYAYLFSLAYIKLDAGVGALILFAAVQITMFMFAWRSGEKIRARTLLGMLLAFSGLVVLLAPGGNAPPATSAFLMLIAGVAWGGYSVLGRRAQYPARETTGNFLRSLPLMAVVVAVGLSRDVLFLTPSGSLYAMASGVLASGAGYVVWYAVVKRLSAQVAAVVQLSVPVLASIAGVLLLAEPLSARLLLASFVVLSGIALALLSPQRKT